MATSGGDAKPPPPPPSPLTLPSPSPPRSDAFGRLVRPRGAGGGEPELAASIAHAALGLCFVCCLHSVDAIKSAKGAYLEISSMIKSPQVRAIA